MTRDHRRLAAIVSADVVGYSLLMGRDESGTLSRMKILRRDIIDPKIVEYGGRIVKTTGDGLLLEFPSVVDAVRCAVNVQQCLSEHNVGLPPDERIDYRIGINVGDIIIDEDDIFGDGVNVAARLEALAEPGGVCVSAAVRDYVLDKLSIAFEDLGPQEVKNIARPVVVYRADLPTGNAQTSGRGRKGWKFLILATRWRWFAASIAGLGIAGISLWVPSQFWKSAPLLTPPPYSVAILPFNTTAGGADDERFAEALTNDLTVALGRTRLRVVSSGLVAGYRGKPFDVRSVGRELNVRYVVEGEVRRAGEQSAINVRLLDTGNATQLWSDHLDVDQAQTTKDPVALVARLTERLRNAANDAEYLRASQPIVHGASATDLASHAYAVWQQDPNSVKGAQEARRLFDQALRLDPNLVQALTAQVGTLSFELTLDLHADHDRLVQEMDNASTRAVNVAPNSVEAWVSRAVALSWEGRWDAAFEANARAMKLEPFRASLLTQRARLMVSTGRPGEALALLDQALALEPQNSQELGTVLLHRCRAYLALRRYDDAIATCEKSVAEDDWWFGHLYLVAAYAQKGETARVSAEKAKLLTQQPSITIADIKALRLSDHPAYLQQAEMSLYSGLRRAGIPEK